ncbi:hypothetical protein ElyMa_003392600 [Elysia marginata]|uniref:Uncharacterized protein n=1 Tax=Elysia marginata TaxID=1093978 RepID=A0AAV4JMG6_9GAST|nr:hypothetical protein ElyMa_003392600 [Elysia marginata]
MESFDRRLRLNFHFSHSRSDDDDGDDDDYDDDDDDDYEDDVLVAHTSAPSRASVTDNNVRYGPRNMPHGIASNGEVSISVTTLDSAFTLLMAVYVCREEAVKDTKQIALGNATGGVEHFDDVGCYLLQ